MTHGVIGIMDTFGQEEVINDMDQYLRLVIPLDAV